MPELLTLSKIRLDGGTQSRAQLSEETIAEYAEKVELLPAAVVFHDGTDYWLADGFHRYRAFERAGRKRMPVEIQQGNQRDAILFSVGANSAHGLRRTNADKRRAVELLLRDAEWSKKSDRWIAEKCGVHHKTVADHRSQLAESASSKPKPSKSLERIQGQDGRWRKAKAETDNVTADDVARAKEALAALPAKRWACPECETEFSLDRVTWDPNGPCPHCDEVAPESEPRPKSEPPTQSTDALANESAPESTPEPTTTEQDEVDFIPELVAERAIGAIDEALAQWPSGTPLDALIAAVRSKLHHLEGLNAKARKRAANG